MRKTILTVILTALVMSICLIGAFLLLRSREDKDSERQEPSLSTELLTKDPESQTDDRFSESGDTEGVSPDIPDINRNETLLDIGVATFNYDSNQLVFDEIPSDEENGAPMVTFMPIDATEPLPRVDCMPIQVSSTGEGEDNFYNMTEESWKTLATTLILRYYSSLSQQSAQISLTNPVVKIEGTTSKMFVNLDVVIPDDIAVQTGDVNLTGIVRLVSSGNNAIVCIALVEQGGTISQALHDAYMSVTLPSS